MLVTAGNLVMKMAEDSERERNLEEAHYLYKRASGYYEADRTSHKTNLETCLLKQADLACLINKEDAYLDAKVVRYFN